MLEILKNTALFVLGTLFILVVLGIPILGLVHLFVSWFGSGSILGFGLYFLTSMMYCGLVLSIIHHWSNK